MSQAYNHLSTELREDVLVISLLDSQITQFEAAEALGSEMMAALTNDLKRVVVDFSNVTFIGSVAYGPFISLRKRLDDQDSKLVICGLSENLQKVFMATRLLINPRADGFGFVVAETIDEAITMEL